MPGTSVPPGHPATADEANAVLRNPGLRRRLGVHQSQVAIPSHVLSACTLREQQVLVALYSDPATVPAHAEVGARLGIAGSTVGVLAARAVRRLRRSLQIPDLASDELVNRALNNTAFLRWLGVDPLPGIVQLLQAWQGLTSRQQEVLITVFARTGTGSRKTSDEAGAVLAMSPASVASHLRRTKHTLVDRLRASTSPLAMNTPQGRSTPIGGAPRPAGFLCDNNHLRA